MPKNKKKLNYNPIFRKFYLEAIAKAKKIYVGEKNTGYNSAGVDIRDYWKFHGPYGLAYELHKKGLRAISITAPQNSAAKNLQETAVDTALDIINYGAFLYAELQCRKSENHSN